jgi:NAD(P) transhydrogenase subunit beta
MNNYLLELSYLIASICFILGLKQLSNPKTARKGNGIAAFGMALAIAGTILLYEVKGVFIKNLDLIVLALLLGTAFGWLAAKRVKMTAMPQLVSLFNGMGGAAAALISLIEYPNTVFREPLITCDGTVIAILLSLVIGAISFSGSMIAFGKLSDFIGDFRKKWTKPANTAILILIVLMFIQILFPIVETKGMILFSLYVLAILSLAYGVLFVLPIGGADMPVVISLLNSFTGVAAAMGGFLYHNQAMLTGGILVGSAGTILTILMCKAMNRSLLNVVLGSFGSASSTAANTAQTGGAVKEIALSDAAVLLSYSAKVVIVPGYGLAVAQAQHLCHELSKLLEEKGVEVKFAIHPVAGRMPGHMNVLLAEADVSYEKLVEMDEINPDLPNVDVVIVIGANDVVNPSATQDPGSPIYGMPVIKAWEAKNVIVIKRGMGKGYAAIENPLFTHDRTRMLFGDAKDALQKLISEVKAG